MEQTLKLMMPYTHHESIKGLLLFVPEMVKQEDLSRRTEKVSPDQCRQANGFKLVGNCQLSLFIEDMNLLGVECISDCIAGANLWALLLQ